MNILGLLRSWFGKLLTPSSTVASIDRLIRREEEGLGGKSMSIAWSDGQFFRTDLTDEFVQAQIAALRAVKEEILAHCDIEHPLVPDGLPDFALQIIEQLGSRLLDPILLAGSKHLMLLSEDLRYRQVAELVNGTKGFWLQPVLARTLEAGLTDEKRVADAYVLLAARRHSHVSLDPGILQRVLDSCRDETLSEFDIITDFIGGKNADMRSHLLVTMKFLARLWNVRKGDLKCQKATGIIVGKLIRFRSADWEVWLSALLFGNSGLTSYLVAWVRGHFLPEGPLIQGYNSWRSGLIGAQARR
jgi:cellulose synthase operon protein C